MVKQGYFSQKSSAIALHRSMFIIQQSADALLLKEAGVGLSHFRLMSQLHPSVARSQKNVAVMLHQTEANVSRQLRLMKKQGLVRISRNKKDKRVREVTLSTKGSKAYKTAVAALDKHYKNFQKNSSLNDLEKTLELLARVA